jgi:hypothetical protein
MRITSDDNPKLRTAPDEPRLRRAASRPIMQQVEADRERVDDGSIGLQVKLRPANRKAKKAKKSSVELLTLSLQLGIER